MCLCTACGTDGTTSARYTATPARGSLMCHWCLEVRNLRAQIAETKAFLSHLEAHLDAFKSYNNHEHDVFNHRFPPEVASYIFVLSTAPGQIPPSSPLKLCAISRLWRQIARATPMLWTRVDVNLNRFEGTYHLPMALFQQWLSRAGLLPLSIHISYDQAKSNLDVHLMKFTEVIDVIIEYSQQWECLKLSIPFSLYPRFRGINTNLRRLVLQPPLGIRNVSSHQGEVFNMGGPPFTSPNEISIDGISYTCVRIDWRKATNLHFASISTFDFLCVLQQAPLVSCCSVSVHLDRNRLYVTITDLIPLLCLAELDITFVNPEAASAILDRITTPCLKNLKYTLPVRQFASLSSLLHRSSCRLTSLSITSRTPERLEPTLLTQGDKNLLAFLWTTSTVEHFSLCIPALPYQFFDVLSPPPIGEERPILLPHLRQFVYRGPLSFMWQSFTTFIGRRGDNKHIGLPALRSVQLHLDPILPKSPEIYYIDSLSTVHIYRQIARGISIEIFNDTIDMLQCSKEYHERSMFGIGEEDDSGSDG
ncbi:hypothetical protein NLJ89_g9574 [Agrocybe chaxingu]|uniref:F-box domain-containing protein n=1 Tax=Agrocybe chaxingu TaxID=84603 RepID=A0A9W8JQI5_9AGAR|nr:hypothetical protein NLJ89_g9574 [Agrocybe chaxingu]